MNEIQVRDLLFEIFPPESDSDWGDVLRRAKRPSPSLRRLTLLVAVVLFAVLAVGSALALSGRLGNLFHGTPVNDLTPRERFLMSEFDMNGKVELIARRKGLAFYVVRRKDGRLCYSIGDVRTHLTPAQREGRFRFGETDCPLGFPSRALPVLNHSYFTYRPGDREARMVGVRGFAANAVARIGVIGRDNEIIFTLPVEGNVYSAGKRGFMGARGIVALDDKGKALWVQCTAIGRSPAPQFPSGGCGRFKNSPPPKVTPPKPAAKADYAVRPGGRAERNRRRSQVRDPRLADRGELHRPHSGTAPPRRLSRWPGRSRLLQAGQGGRSGECPGNVFHEAVRVRSASQSVEPVCASSDGVRAL